MFHHWIDFHIRTSKARHTIYFYIWAKTFPLRKRLVPLYLVTQTNTYFQWNSTPRALLEDSIGLWNRPSYTRRVHKKTRHFQNLFDMWFEMTTINIIYQFKTKNFHYSYEALSHKNTLRNSKIEEKFNRKISFHFWLFFLYF